MSLWETAATAYEEVTWEYVCLCRVLGRRRAYIQPTWEPLIPGQILLDEEKYKGSLRVGFREFVKKSLGSEQDCFVGRVKLESGIVLLGDCTNQIQSRDVDKLKCIFLNINS